MRREREREGKEGREDEGGERRLRIASSMGNFEYERKFVPRRALRNALKDAHTYLEENFILLKYHIF